MDDDSLPNIVPLFFSNRHSDTLPIYKELIGKTLKKILPSYIFSGEKPRKEEFALFRQALPLLTWSEIPKETPGDISFFLICRFRYDAFRFFYDMISRWLIPSRRVPVPSLYAVDFSFEGEEGELYTLVEIIARAENPKDLQALKRNLWVVEAEIHIGADSNYKASRVLEVKGLSSDQKGALVHEYILSLLQRRPKHLGEDVFVEMQHLLVVCGEEFKKQRDYRHIGRIIAVLYLFRKALQDACAQEPDKRHIFVKLIPAQIESASGKRKKVLGCLVLLNFIDENEVFEEKHLLSAIQSIIPEARDVADSFFSYRSKLGANSALYMEVETGDGSHFSRDSIAKLRQELQGELHSRIEQLMHAVFMPRNEEEVAKNILKLRDELQYVKDIPQVMISFEEQTSSQLVFNVILLRVLKPGMQPIKDLFYQAETSLEISVDREKVVGLLRNQYAKEATVFRLYLRKVPFMRKNRAIDLNRARKTISKELEKVIGSFRDYNGGIFLKQEELLASTRALLGASLKGKEYLFESFFYGISPDIIRGVLAPLNLKKFFLLALEGIELKKSMVSLIREDKEHFYFLVICDDGRFRQEFKHVMSSHISKSPLALTVSLNYRDKLIDGAMLSPIEKKKLVETFPFLKEKSEKNCV